MILGPTEPFSQLTIWNNAESDKGTEEDNVRSTEKAPASRKTGPKACF
jgi:hypothetical protein